MTATLELVARPRTGKPFQATVRVAGFVPSNVYYQLLIGCKSTAGAPADSEDFDVSMNAGNLLDSGLVALSQGAGHALRGQLVRRDVQFTHAPGANVKVYAAIQVGTDTDEAFTAVSPGVLLGA